MIVTRTIVDAYHGDEGLNIGLLANNGVQGLILKATQGLSYVDPTYAQRRLDAGLYGLLVGSYHFADNSDPMKQVDHWLNTAAPTANEVVAFDWESNGASTMSYSQACAFVQEVHRRTGRFPMIYGSNLLNEKIPAGADSILFKCPLWLAGYSSAPTVPHGWTHYTLWQYTGDGQGPNRPHTFHGAAGDLDISQFDGGIFDLRAKWPFAS